MKIYVPVILLSALLSLPAFANPAWRARIAEVAGPGFSATEVDALVGGFSAFAERRPPSAAEAAAMARLTPEQLQQFRDSPPPGVVEVDMSTIIAGVENLRPPIAATASPAPSPRPTTTGGRGGGGERGAQPSPAPTQTASTGSSGTSGTNSKGGNKIELKPPTVPLPTGNNAVSLATMLAGAAGGATGKSEGGIFSALSARPSQGNALVFNNGGDLKGTWDNISRIISGMLTVGGRGQTTTVVASASPTATTTTNPVPANTRSPAFMASDRLVTSGTASAGGGFDFGAASGSSPSARFLVDEPAAMKAAAAGAAGRSSEGARVRVFGGEYGESSSESSGGTVSIRNGTAGGATADSNEPIASGGHKGAY